MRVDFNDKAARDARARIAARAHVRKVRLMAWLVGAMLLYIAVNM